MRNVEDGICCRCGADCDGSLMRMDPRFDRVRHILTSPDVPRFSGGGIALCYWCQRSTYWAKGFLAMLIKDLKTTALFGAKNGNAGGNATYDPRQPVWDEIIKLSATGAKVSDIAALAGCEVTTVYDVMRKHNLPTPTQLRKAERRQSKLKGFGEDRAEKVRDMRLGGQEWHSIAAKMGESREAVMSAHICLTGAL